MLAGTLAILTVAVYLPANVGTGGIFGSTAIVAKAEEYTVTWDSLSGMGSMSQNGVTLTTADSVPPPRIGANFYNDRGGCTFSTDNGVNFTKIEFTCTYSNQAYLSDNLTLSNNVVTWTGNSPSVSFDAMMDNVSKVVFTTDAPIILQASVTIPPTANPLTCDGTEQELVTAGTATNGTMQYKLGADGTYSTNIPTATNAGTYTVYYKAVGNDGYEDSAEASVTLITGFSSVP